MTNLTLSEQLLGINEEHLCLVDDSILIHKGMKKDFIALTNAAKLDGITLKIASGYRSFERQLLIWNNKFSGKTKIKSSAGNIISPAGLSDVELMHHILLYSALPGASRHHWGCDIDIYAPNLLPDGSQLQLEPWEYEENGPFYQLSTWLTTHAHQFGFYLPYASYQGGVAQEPWHLSYLPLAQKFQQAFDINLLAHTLNKSNILGKDTIIKNISAIAQRYINNTCEAPTNVIKSIT